jgi:prepilin-type N-terminal cleavage/methylation domain-containing protein
VSIRFHPWLKKPRTANREPRTIPRGFTLLEMMLVMFIVSLLIASVFGIVSSMTQLTNDMTVEQQRDARMHAFVELCSRTFRNVPPSAMVRLRNNDIGGRVTSTLVLAGATSPVSGEAAGVTVLETVQATDGYLSVILRSMTEAQAAAWEKGDTSVGLRVPLLENVASFEWKVFHPISGTWASLWNEKVNLPDPSVYASGASPAGLFPPPSRRPSVIELKFAIGTEQVQRHIFWIPPAEPLNPRAGLVMPPDSPPPGDAPPPTDGPTPPSPAPP